MRKTEKGYIVELLYMEDIKPVEAWTLGVADHVDDKGQIHVRWENGRYLAVSKEYGDDFLCFEKKDFLSKRLEKHAFLRYRAYLKKNGSDKAENLCYENFTGDEFKDTNLMRKVLGKLGFSLYLEKTEERL